jgi:hypothetical protein
VVKVKSRRVPNHSSGIGAAAIRDRLGQVDSRSHDAVIWVYDDAGNVIQTHEHKGDFKDW